MISSPTELGEAWRRRCRLSELLLRFDAPPDETALPAAVYGRATGDDPPDSVLSGHANGYAAALWEAPGEVIQAQIAELVGAALEIPGARPAELVKVHGIMAAAAAQTVIEAWRHRAMRDALTGLGNRLAMDDDSSRFPGTQPLAVAYLDLDGLKSINDTAGDHNAGSDYIKVFALELKQRIGLDGKVYRRGGDEFVILLRLSELDARTLLQRTQSDMSETPFSWGLAIRPEDGEDISKLERAADHRMYSDKARRRTGSGVFEAASPAPADSIDRDGAVSSLGDDW